MIIRAVLAFCVLPGVVAYLIPFLVALQSPLPEGHRLLALVPMSVGTMGLLVCVRSFYATGKGTLAAWEPPANLVTVQLYGFTRNPMYLSVLLLLVGWAWLAGSQLLVIYALVVAGVFHMHVVFAEEPWAARTFGSQWVEYKDSVPRWIGIPRRRAKPREDARSIVQSGAEHPPGE